MTEVLKLLIKEAVLEALMEFANLSIAVASGTENNNSGGSNTGANSGGTPGSDGRPKPDVGVGTWSRR